MMKCVHLNFFFFFCVNVVTSIMITQPLDEKGKFDTFILMNF